MEEARRLRIISLAKEHGVSTRSCWDFLERLDVELTKHPVPSFWRADEGFDAAFDEFASRTEIIGRGVPYHAENDL